MHLHAVQDGGEGGGEGSSGEGLKPPPQAQHIVSEVKSSSSFCVNPQKPELLLYIEQPKPSTLVAPKSWSVHAIGGAGGDLNPPPQAQHISFEVKSSSS